MLGCTKQQSVAVDISKKYLNIPGAVQIIIIASIYVFYRGVMHAKYTSMTLIRIQFW